MYFPQIFFCGGVSGYDLRGLHLRVEPGRTEGRKGGLAPELEGRALGWSLAPEVTEGPWFSRLLPSSSFFCVGLVALLGAPGWRRCWGVLKLFKIIKHILVMSLVSGCWRPLLYKFYI